MKQLRKITLFILALSICITSGCMDTEKKGEAKMALLKTTNPNPAVLNETDEEFAFSEELHKYVLSFDDIYDAAIIVGEKRVLVAYKVKHMRRYKMKKIEKDLKEKLEKKYPDRKFTVSSDYKIFLEAVELNEDLKDPDYSRKKANKHFKKIIKLEKEKT